MKKTLYIDINCIATAAGNDGSDNCRLQFSRGAFHNLFRIANQLDHGLVLYTSEKQDMLTGDVKDFCEREDIFFEEIVNQSELDQRLKYKSSEKRVLVCEPTNKISALFKNEVIYMNRVGSVSTLQQDWRGVYDFLASTQRSATVIRRTSETDIQCFLNLDGNGENNIATGLGFFDHMLQQIARHGNIDLNISVKGDLHIDEHHTIEDVGLALGATFNEALGNKKGIERYGFLLPMDDCLAQVALDFGGRAWIVWKADFKREKIGDMPTEMFYHFFKSFSDAARCNLNIVAEGENEHHKIESIFKAFAKSIRMAIAKTNNNSIPSTKGTL